MARQPTAAAGFVLMDALAAVALTSIAVAGGWGAFSAAFLRLSESDSRFEAVDRLADLGERARLGIAEPAYAASPGAMRAWAEAREGIPGASTWDVTAEWRERSSAEPRRVTQRVEAWR
jgi:hypothetical protein